MISFDWPMARSDALLCKNSWTQGNFAQSSGHSSWQAYTCAEAQPQNGALGPCQGPLRTCWAGLPFQCLAVTLCWQFTSSKWMQFDTDTGRALASSIPFVSYWMVRGTTGSSCSWLFTNISYAQCNYNQHSGRQRAFYSINQPQSSLSFSPSKSKISCHILSIWSSAAPSARISCCHPPICPYWQLKVKSYPMTKWSSHGWL